MTPSDYRSVPFFVYILLLLFVLACFAPAAFGQPSSVVQTTVCTFDLDDSIPLVSATVRAQATGLDAVENLTGANGCVTLSVPVAVSNEGGPELPDRFLAGTPYPNPGVDRVSIPFEIDAAQAVSFQLYDLQGRAVSALFTREAPAGSHQLDVRLGNLAPGVYVFRLQGHTGVGTGTLVKIDGSASTSRPDVRLTSRNDGPAPSLRIAAASRVRFQASKEGYGALATDLDVEDGETVELYLQKLTDTGSNNPPVLPPFSDATVGVNQSISFAIAASDPDGDAITLEASMSRTGSSQPGPHIFTDNGDGTGLLVVSPSAGDEGEWTATLSASDGKTNTERTFSITVTGEPVNSPPAIAAIDNATILEGGLLIIPVSASDANGDAITLTAEIDQDGGGAAPNGFFTFTDQGDGSGSLQVTPAAGAAGTYIATITASDGTDDATETFSIFVTAEGENTPPIVNALSNRSMFEGETLSVAITGSDADGDAFSISADVVLEGGGAAPEGLYTFSDQGDGTATLEFTPAPGDAGNYTATVIADDGQASSSESFTLQVKASQSNTPPSISPIGDVNMVEGGSQTVAITASDADGDAIVLGASAEVSGGGAAPAGLFTFTDNGAGAGEIELTPEPGQSGVYVFTVTAADAATQVETTFTVTVNPSTGNSVPVVAAIDDRSVAEGATLQVAVSASDADGDALTLEAEVETTNGTPVGAGFFTFSDQGNGSGTLQVTPEAGDASVYTATVSASDGQATGTRTFTITVTTGGGSSDMIPLIDMGAQTYHGFTGGLYPNASNEMPASHYNAGVDIAKSIEPLDTGGNPSPNGKYVMISLGMSNTTQEFCSKNSDIPCDSWTFMGQAAADPDVNTSNLVIVNGAKGGQSAENWETPTDGNYDRIKNDKLIPQGLSESQVQVAWVKVANPQPLVSLPSAGADAFRLQGQIGNIVRALKSRYPNLKQVFLTSRIYAGYAGTPLNPEPYAYESGFSVKWLIEAQVDQMDGKGVDDTSGNMDYNSVAAWTAWAAYPWADGMNPRSDGLFWEPTDLEGDGTHPSMFGEEKVGALLLDFFKNSPQTKCWFLENGVCE